MDGKSAFPPDFIFAMDWLEYRLEQYNVIRTAPPSIIVFPAYVHRMYIHSIDTVTRQVWIKCPAAYDDIRNDLECILFRWERIKGIKIPGTAIFREPVCIQGQICQIPGAALPIEISGFYDNAIKLWMLVRKIKENSTTPFWNILKIIRDLAPKVNEPFDTEIIRSGKNLVEEIKNGLRPNFIQQLDTAMRRAFEIPKNFKIEFTIPPLNHTESEDNVFHLQEYLFTRILNFSTEYPLSKKFPDVDGDQKSRHAIANRFFDACVNKFRINSRSAATYGLIAYKRGNLDDTAVINKIKEEIIEWRRDEKICSKARRLLTNEFNVEFERAPIGRAGKGTNNILKMEPHLFEILKEISIEGYTRKDFE